MRIRKGFVLRKICGEWVIEGEGLEQIDFNKLVILNTSAAYLWEQVEEEEFSVEQLADLLIKRYGIARELAVRDAASLCEQWVKVGLVE